MNPEDPSTLRDSGVKDRSGQFKRTRNVYNLPCQRCSASTREGKTMTDRNKTPDGTGTASIAGASTPGDGERACKSHESCCDRQALVGSTLGPGWACRRRLWAPLSASSWHGSSGCANSGCMSPYAVPLPILRPGPLEPGQPGLCDQYHALRRPGRTIVHVSPVTGIFCRR
jgi:hypothetical protein